MKKYTSCMAVLILFGSCVLWSFPLQHNASFLWEIRANSGQQGYILGSIHLLKPEHFPLKQVIEDAFAASDMLVVEADISKNKMAEAAAMQWQKGIYAQGDSLKNHISESTWNAAAERLKGLGMNIDFYKSFKPWLVALTITSLEMMKLGYNPNLGIDKYFLDRAENREIVELEGLAYQMELFDGFSDETNDRFLLYSIKEAEKLESGLDEMVAYWMQGNVSEMTKMVTANIEKYPDMKAMYEKIVTERNRLMADRISKLLYNKKTPFIVVGAAHLVGETGIVALLKKKGFTLKQL